MQPNRISMCDDEMRLQFDNGERIFLWFLLHCVSFERQKFLFAFNAFILSTFKIGLKDLIYHVIPFRFFQLICRIYKWCQKFNVAYGKGRR